MPQKSQFSVAEIISACLGEACFQLCFFLIFGVQAKTFHTDEALRRNPVSLAFSHMSFAWHFLLCGECWFSFYRIKRPTFSTFYDLFHWLWMAFFLFFNLLGLSCLLDSFGFDGHLFSTIPNFSLEEAWSWKRSSWCLLFSCPSWDPWRECHPVLLPYLHVFALSKLDPLPDWIWCHKRISNQLENVVYLHPDDVWRFMSRILHDKILSLQQPITAWWIFSSLFDYILSHDKLLIWCAFI